MTGVGVGALVLVSGVAAVVDVRTGRIPNWLTLPAAAAGLLGHVLVDGAAGARQSLLGPVVGVVVPWRPWRRTSSKAIGGGDVKLFAALGALGGPVLGLEVQLSAFVLLTVFALLRLAFLGKLLSVLGSAVRLLVQPLLPARWRRPPVAEAWTEMRMGPAIAGGVMAVLARDHLVQLVPWLA